MEKTKQKTKYGVNGEAENVQVRRWRGETLPSISLHLIGWGEQLWYLEKICWERLFYSRKFASAAFKVLSFYYMFQTKIQKDSCGMYVITSVKYSHML